MFSSVHNTNLEKGFRSGFVLREGSFINALMVELSGCFLTEFGISYFKVHF